MDGLESVLAEVLVRVEELVVVVQIVSNVLDGHLPSLCDSFGLAIVKRFHLIIGLDELCDHVFDLLTNCL